MRDEESLKKYWDQMILIAKMTRENGLMWEGPLNKIIVPKIINK